MKRNRKVAVIVGAPTSVENEYEERRPLAYIYIKKRFFSGKRDVFVHPAAPEYVAFANAAKQGIMARIERNPAQTFIYADPTHEWPHRNKVVGIDDLDVIEGIGKDELLWNWHEHGIVADHYVLPGYSYIEKRKI